MHRHSYFFNALIDRERYRLFKHARLSLTYIVRVMIILFMYPIQNGKTQECILSNNSPLLHPFIIIYTCKYVERIHYVTARERIFISHNLNLQYTIRNILQSCEEK